jgi:hypothetical protein
MWGRSRRTTRRGRWWCEEREGEADMKKRRGFAEGDNANAESELAAARYDMCVVWDSGGCTFAQDCAEGLSGQ